MSPAVDRELKNVLPNPPTNPLGELSEQERRVLAAVADGKTDKEIAVALGLQPKTVRNYLERVFEKTRGELTHPGCRAV